MEHDRAMRYAVISDIHGNIEALQAVIADIAHRSVDRIVCLGDIVGYYPDPESCIDLVRAESDLCIAGNHDFAAIGLIDTANFTYFAFAAMEWTKSALSSGAKKFLASLPLTAEKNGIFFAHASPASPEQWGYIFPDSEGAIFEAFTAIASPLNFIGHTHWPSIMIQSGDRISLHPEHAIRLRPESCYLINAGSVGQPRDFDSRSCYALYDTESQTVSIIRVTYDFTITQRKIRDNHLPIFLAERLEKGR
jgi:diadenosine tetraphosphatase ApaH/serine/threonine PP2A family protein phosphatase